MVNLALFGKLQNLTANISGTDGDIEYRKTILLTAILPTLDGKSPVNFGPLTTAFTRIMFIHRINFFSDYHIAAPMGVLRPKIFTRTRE